jgi:phage virion morphogenesis protein
MAEAGVSLSLTLTGGDAVGRALFGLQFHVENLRPVHDEIGAAFLMRSQRCFEEERGPDGKPWKLLSAETVLKRAGGRAKVYNAKGGIRKPAAKRIGAIAILRESARLFQSMTYRATRTGVEIGTNAVYGRIHLLGGQAGRGRKVAIPARPYLPTKELPHGWAEDALAIVNDYIRGGLPR